MSSTPLLVNVPAPFGDAVARPRNWVKYPNPRDKDPNEGLMSKPWQDYETGRQNALTRSAYRLNAVSLVDQGASIGATDISGGILTAGIYQLSYYAQITKAAGVSSSLEVTFGWTFDGVAQSQTDTAITGNTLTTVQSKTWLIHIDLASPVTYATTYASSGAPAMEHSLDVVLMRISA